MITQCPGTSGDWDTTSFLPVMPLCVYWGAICVVVVGVCLYVVVCVYTLRTVCE